MPLSKSPISPPYPQHFFFSFFFGQSLILFLEYCVQPKQRDSQSSWGEGDHGNVAIARKPAFSHTVLPSFTPKLPDFVLLPLWFAGRRSVGEECWRDTRNSLCLVFARAARASDWNTKVSKNWIIVESYCVEAIIRIKCLKLFISNLVKWEKIWFENIFKKVAHTVSK